jgi:two-component system cell cycle response regulator CtrA
MLALCVGTTLERVQADSKRPLRHPGESRRSAVPQALLLDSGFCRNDMKECATFGLGENALFTSEAGTPRPLDHGGFRFEHVASGEEALELLRLYDYSAVLAGDRLPDMPAHGLLRAMRAMDLNTPVLVIASNATPHLKARLLDEGADDVVDLSCDAEELLARLRAIVRRSGRHITSTLQFGPLELCLTRREVRVQGWPLRLSPREYSLLELLGMKGGGVLNRNTILDHLYGAMGETDAKAVDVLVCRLRKKLAKAGVPDLVETVRGGYALRVPAAAPQPKRAPAMSAPRQREPAFA